MALAPDAPTSVGGYPGDDAGAELFTKVDNAKKTEDFVAAAMCRRRVPIAPARLASLASATAVDGTRWLPASARSRRGGADYGGAPQADVPKIKAAILVHHGVRHRRGSMARTMPHRRRPACPRATSNRRGARIQLRRDTRARHNKAASDPAWQRTIDGFNTHVRAWTKEGENQGVVMWRWVK
jgi:carboxymethylenebutenolidase